MQKAYEWKTLVYMEPELSGEEIFLTRAKKWGGITLLRMQEPRQLAQLPAKEECLLVSPKAATLRRACGLGIASVACRLPEFPGEDLSAEPMILEGLAEADREFFLRRYQRFHGIPWTIAQTRRCIIRELELSDVPALEALYEGLDQEEGVEPLLPPEEELEKERAYIDHMYRFYEFGMWLVFEKNTQSLIGRAGLELFEWAGKSCVELGYVIAPAYRRRGYAAEVCRKILEYAAQTLDIMDIYLRVKPDNPASLGLAGKLGFSKTTGSDIFYKKLR